MAQRQEIETVGDAPPLLAQLAAKIEAFGPDLATGVALERAKAGIIDTIAVTLAGMSEPCSQILLKTEGLAAAGGPCLIFGSKRRTGPLDAAMINGTASHALDYDDFSGVFGGHQSVPLVAPLIALAEARGLSGRALLLAYLVGVETEIRLARAVFYHHYDKGWHPTATLGTIGGAAAAAHLLGLDRQRLTMALAIAPSLASGLKANFGTMSKPLQVGQCARNGLLAALLAEGGFDANAAVLEHHQGFFEVYNGPGQYQSERLLENWADPLEIEAPSIALKQFPCCGSTHPAITLMLELKQAEDFSADDVSAIEILPHGRRLRHTDTPWPTTGLEAKFSVQYVVARALLDGAVRLKDFDAERWREPAVERLLALIRARAHPDLADDGPEQWGTEVRVILADGRKLGRRVDNLIGRGGDNAMSRAEMWDKFADCGSRALPETQLETLFDRLYELETVGDLNQLTRLMQGSD